MNTNLKDIELKERTDFIPEDIQLIKDWIREESDINDVLCQPESELFNADRERLIKNIAKANQLQRVILSETLNTEYIVFRGTNNIEQVRIQPYIFPGDYSDKTAYYSECAFLPFSYDLEVAIKFSKPSLQGHLIILTSFIPKGCHALYIGDYPVNDSDNESLREREILLPKDLKYKIVELVPYQVTPTIRIVFYFILFKPMIFWGNDITSQAKIIEYSTKIKKEIEDKLPNIKMEAYNGKKCTPL
ncbi:ADP-ribosyltransferase [Methanospirillum purgamenti]|jgi:hypothetical protein|uniref:ADP-ribosyltransferase n=1 Tax=Methanospirillum hungatei TaxID=2203 RepID=A0A8F5VN92_METHU|nr:ADP-ribosyltransferase [Methanospirillum hungatei]QXO95291.1 ADP-ribosyltransferase [Methanospirillum hungatei]